MSIPCSRSAEEMKAAQAGSLDRLRPTLVGMNIKDVVPILVARNVLKSQEMRAVYEKESDSDKVDALIALLKTKNHWIGPLTDALIRNGQAATARTFMQMQQDNIVS